MDALAALAQELGAQGALIVAFILLFRRFLARDEKEHAKHYEQQTQILDRAEFIVERLDEIEEKLDRLEETLGDV